jgi:hypothetical protein
MSARRIDPPQPPKGEQAPAANEPRANPPLAVAPREGPQPDSGQPGGGQGRIDVTGVVPEGMRVDPDLTEGHPGYEESGDSEVIPPERLTGGGAKAEKDRAS